MGIYIYLISQNKIKMKGSLTIMKPLKQRSKSALTSNMFQDPDKVEADSLLHRENIEQYDFVGPLQFRKKIMTKYGQPLKLQPRDSKQQQDLKQFNQTVGSKNAMNTTVHRNTMLESLHTDQINELTRQSKNLNRFKEYQQIWEAKKLAIMRETNKKTPILMDCNIKTLYAHPNEDKINIINNHIVHYWQMSLRNNHPTLEKHIRGNRFQKIQKEKLMQFRAGIKKLQNSIPVLPLEKLSGIKHREISLTGKNKIKRELDGETVQSQTRYSLPTTARLAQQEVFKIDYQGPKRWMGTQNL